MTALKTMTALRLAWVRVYLMAAELADTQRRLPIEVMEGLRRDLLDQIRREAQHLTRLGVQAALIDDLQLAVVALVDEAAAAQFKGSWSPLQLELYQTANAGERVFERLEEALARSSDELPLLEGYHRSLMFGLQGKYATQPDKLDRLRTQLEARIDQLNPSQKPLALLRKLLPGRRSEVLHPLIAVPMALLLCLGLWLYLAWFARLQTHNTVERLQPLLETVLQTRSK